jgi:hypothetical protein
MSLAAKPDMLIYLGKPQILSYCPPPAAARLLAGNKNGDP